MYMMKSKDIALWSLVAFLVIIIIYMSWTRREGYSPDQCDMALRRVEQFHKDVMKKCSRRGGKEKGMKKKSPSPTKMEVEASPTKMEVEKD